MSFETSLEPNVLLDIGASVSEAAASIEDVFLAVGEGLGRALGDIDDVLAAADAIPRNLSGDQLSHTKQALLAAANRLERLTSGLPQEKAALDHISAQLFRLHEPVERLVATIRTISILARSVRIETAYLGGDDMDFYAFSTEIMKLADEGWKGITVFVQGFASLRAMLNSARDQHASFYEGRRWRIERGISELREAVAAVEARQASAVLASERISAASRAISDSVGHAIFSLQSGDRTRQRLEHVNEALAEAAHAEPFDDTQACATAALQSAQLEHALSDFHVEIGRIETAIGALSTQAGDVVQMGQALVRESSGSSGSQDALGDKLRAVAALVAECKDSRSSVEGALSNLIETLTSFQEGLSALGRISTSITSIGLNASIKSFRLGARGRGLAAISDDLKLYAERVDEDVHVFVAAFEQVLKMASELGSIAGMDAGQDEDIAVLLASLHDTDARALGAVAEIASKGEQTAAVLSRLPSAFARLAGTLDLVRGEAARLAAHGSRADLEHLEALGRLERYTMQEERSIHQALVARRAA